MTSKDFARFWSQVDVLPDPAQCWEWRGETFAERGEYGRFNIGGTSRRAHRVAFEMANGPVADDQVVRHVCDNAACCNPAHLISGTYAENTADMFTRGRNPDRRGEKHPLARLTAEQVREIRRAAAMGHTYGDIAGTYGISHQQVGKIVRRDNWRHV